MPGNTTSQTVDKAFGATPWTKPSLGSELTFSKALFEGDGFAASRLIEATSLAGQI